MRDEDRPLSACAAARAIAEGTLRSEALVSECLARIAAREPVLHAWAHVDPGLALKNARACDLHPYAGLLRGIPVGVKDVLDTHDMPTAHGSVLYEGQRPARDSECVAALRRAGAVILGKTSTTEFASPIAAGVRNPHDLTRTAGVSSSGSAAAVADGMVPLALGTQTGGSVIRPASYCGVFGYKASIDGLPRGGIRHFRPSLDAVGLFARTLPDIALLRAGMLGHSSVTATAWSQSRAPRLGFCRGPEWHLAEPATRQALEHAAGRLRSAGADTRNVELPAPFEHALEAFGVIVLRETAVTMTPEFRDHLNALNPWLRSVAANAQAVSDARYRHALAVAQECRVQLARIFRDVDALITPAAAGEAPQDLFGAADPAFGPLWTLMHGPSISIPACRGPHGMPVGMQVVAAVGADDRLLAVADWIVAALRPPGT